MALRSEGRFISLGDVKSGMIVRFSYEKSYGDKETKQYTVLVIDPLLQNEHASEYQMHALLIKDLDDFQLLKLITILSGKDQNDIYDFIFIYENTEMTSEEIEFWRKQPIAELDNDDSYEAYKTNYAPARRYRTFNLTGISGLQQLLLGVPKSVYTTTGKKKI